MDLARSTTALAEVIIEVETDAHDAAIARARSEREVAALRDDIDVLRAAIAPWEETAQQHAQNVAVATETAKEARQRFYELIDDEYEQLCATEQLSDPASSDIGSLGEGGQL